MNLRPGILILILFTALLSSCDSNSDHSAPPIEMGDPATIVTERDSQYLKDLVVDLNLAPRPVTIAEEQPAAAKDSTPAPNIPPTQPTKTELMTGSGLKVPFPQVTLYIPNIETKTYQKINFETDYGASYEITAGELDGNQLVVDGHGEISDVYMRYQTIIVARNNLGMLPLESLRELTDWKKVTGKNGIYKIEGLEPGKLKYVKVSNRAIRNAVSRATRARKYSRRGAQNWLNSVRKTKHTKDEPLHVELRSVMWKVIGKDENGRPFTRQLRIDIPVKP